jgi:hypothetical protein
MSRVRLIFVFSIGVLFLIDPVVAGGDQWQPVRDATGNVGITIDDSISASIGNVSNVSAVTGTSTGGFQNVFLCDTFATSGPCDIQQTAQNSGGSVRATILLPVCSSETSINCVADLSLGSSSSSMARATFVRMANGDALTADPSVALPEGSTVGLWTSDVSNAGSTSTYATWAELSMVLSNGVFTPTQLQVQVVPYRTTTGQEFQVPTASDFVGASGNNAVEIAHYPGCFWEEIGLCYRSQDFTPNTAVSLSLRIPNSVGGWFKGRLVNPTMSVAKFNSSENLLKVTAPSIATPMLSYQEPQSQVDPTLATYFGLLGGFHQNWNVENGLVGALAAVNASRVAVSNTASGSINQWSFATVRGTQSNSCLSDTSEILGLITTNALAYGADVPAFDGAKFSYGVAGMHYLADGSLALGTYDMVMRDSVAQCLYKFSNAPISASVSVTEDSSGNQNVATMTVSDYGGWIHVGAYGAHSGESGHSFRLNPAT